MERTREPAVAGQFYPGDKKSLTRILDKFIEQILEKTKAVAVICPHAGYVYSGKVAGAVFARVLIPGKVIIIGPNHTGYGEPFALMKQGTWSTPLGSSAIDMELAEKILNRCHYLQADEMAHRYEHSLEVQLPFIQYLNPLARIVPIVLSGSPESGIFKEIAGGLAETLKEEKDFLIVASSDMTHYESNDSASEKDHYALEAILKLDETELVKRIIEKRISMCGYGPVIVTLITSRILGAEKARLVKYTTSAETSGDYEQVVGYAGVLIE